MNHFIFFENSGSGFRIMKCSVCQLLGQYLISLRCSYCAQSQKQG
jgi:formate dehydrogenase maturation protein FdhE